MKKVILTRMGDSSRFFSLEIINFVFSNVNHTCPGWMECGELKEVWCELQLDRVNFRFKSRPVAGLDYLFWLFVMVVLTLFVFVVSSGTPANWRM